jgi:hypothetical protein
MPVNSDLVRKALTANESVLKFKWDPVPSEALR